MAGAALHLPAKCPRCLASLMCPALPVDGLPSVTLRAKVGDRIGRIQLSQVYGSFEKVFLGVPDLPGSVEEFSCPLCLEPFPLHGTCACGAPLVEVDLLCGGAIRFCARNGCREHHLEFEEPDEAFEVYEVLEE